MDLLTIYETTVKKQTRFIRKVLLRMGFSDTWTELIIQCCSTVSYSFLLDDSAHGKIFPTRGIRQGDPLSPYLFILYSEVLSGLCSQAQHIGHLKGISAGRRGPKINHLLFADDTMFFLKTDQDSCTALINILRSYEQASGQKINVTKSSITFATKTPEETRSRVKSFLGIVKEGGTGKYLGLPELFGRRKKYLFTSIVDRIRVKANSYSSRLLSPAGKLIMIKAILSAIPTHASSCFLLPLSLCKRIQSAFTRFWWDAADQKKICWIAWSKITLPKLMGGLGVRDIQLFNVALLAKQAWRIVTAPHSLLSRMLMGRYCQNSSFVDVLPTSNASHGWRSVLKWRDLLITQLGKAVGDGNSTRVWKDRWILSNNTGTPVGPPKEMDRDLMVSDLLTRGTNEWNLHALQASSQVYWELLMNLFGYLTKMGALPLGANLEKRGCGSTITCPRCGERETADHLILACPFAKQVWTDAPLQYGFDPDQFSSLSEALLSGMRTICLPPTGVSQPIFPWICWCLWTSRNKLIFENKVLSASEVLSLSITSAREWWLAQPTAMKAPRQPNLIIPTLNAEANCVSVFADTEWRASDGATGCGWIFKDSTRQSTQHGSKCFDNTALIYLLLCNAALTT
ncbi:hypothetical protein Bca101_036191 [Brassica carinata]